MTPATPPENPLAARPNVPTFVIRLWKPLSVGAWASSNPWDTASHVYAGHDGKPVLWEGMARKFNTKPDALLWAAPFEAGWKEAGLTLCDPWPVDVAAIERQWAERERFATKVFADRPKPRPSLAARVLRAISGRPVERNGHVEVGAK